MIKIVANRCLVLFIKHCKTLQHLTLDSLGLCILLFLFCIIIITSITITNMFIISIILTWCEAEIYINSKSGTPN